MALSSTRISLRHDASPNSARLILYVDASLLYHNLVFNVFNHEQFVFPINFKIYVSYRFIHENFVFINHFIWLIHPSSFYFDDHFQNLIFNWLTHERVFLPINFKTWAFLINSGLLLIDHFKTYFPYCIFMYIIFYIWWSVACYIYIHTSWFQSLRHIDRKHEPSGKSQQEIACYPW